MPKETDRLRDQVTAKVDDYERLEDGMLVDLYVSNDSLAAFLEFIYKAERGDSNE